MIGIIYAFPYILLFVLTLILSLPIVRSINYLKVPGDSAYRYFVFACVFLFFFGFRGYIYTDWVVYAVFYDKLPNIGSLPDVCNFITSSEYALVGWERGFLLYSILIKSISFNYFSWQFIFVLNDFIVLILVFRNYISQKNVVLCFLFFLMYGGIVIEFNLLRNSKALLFFYLSIKYLKDKKVVPYIVLNLIGALFHTASFLFIPLYFILNRKYSTKLVFLLYVVGNFIFIFRISWLLPIIDVILHFFSLGRISLVMKDYINSQSYGITLSYVQRLVEFLIIIFIGKKYVSYDKYYYLYNMFFLYHFVYLFFTEILVFVERFSILFVFSYWILLPKFFENLTLKNKKIFLLFFFYWGLIVLIKSNAKVVCYYDNYLLNYLDYNERKLILDAFYNQ